jgi:hypothetical protein
MNTFEIYLRETFVDYSNQKFLKYIQEISELQNIKCERIFKLLLPLGEKTWI